MIMYAATPARRTRQILGDLGVLLWTLLWVLVGRFVYGLVAALANPVRTLSDAGGTFAGTMRDTGAQVQDLPVVGSQLAQAFEKVAGGASGVEGSGAGLAHQIENLGLAIGILVAATPILLVLLPWAWRRWQFASLAGATQRLIDSDADLDLFALRALATQPLPKLATISADPAGAWRRGDPEVTRRLAALALKDAGLLPPSLPAASSGAPSVTQRR